MILAVTLNTSIDKFYLLDRFEPYRVMRVSRVVNTAGGKGMNVARIAAMGGEAVTAMGFVGGFNGQYFESLISEPNIKKAFTHIRAETRSCINGWDDSLKRSTEYLEPGAQVTGDEVELFFADFHRELSNAHVVTISGSMPAGAPQDFYAKLIGLCKEKRVPVLLDTSGEALRRAARAGPTFIKPNTDELRQLMGREVSSLEDVIASARELYEGGIAYVVISLGAEGAVMVCRDGVFHGRPPRIEPVNTVGCGDSMTGGFAIGFSRGWSAYKSIGYAVAVSAANALSMGTGSYDPVVFDNLLSKVIIQKIDS
jgi:tagatose 6-phosphate kinase